MVNGVGVSHRPTVVVGEKPICCWVSLQRCPSGSGGGEVKELRDLRIGIASSIVLM